MHVFLRLFIKTINIPDQCPKKPGNMKKNIYALILICNLIKYIKIR